MRISKTWASDVWDFSLLILFAAFVLAPAMAVAAPPVVKTVPWVATNPLIPHDTWSGKIVTLKGTADMQGANIQYTWDFGDGSPVAIGTVIDRYAIQAVHAYTGAAGTVYTARLIVQNTSTGETGTKEYYVEIRDRTLEAEVNVAIDEGLWYLHKTQTRAVLGGVPVGYWSGGYAGYGYYGVSVLNVNAFEVNGHLASGNPDNPYVETAGRGLAQLFAWLTSGAIGSQTNGLGTFNPDANGNGLGVYVAQSYPFYQGGMFMDAIIASGTPDAIASTGPANVIGRKFKDIVQDMADLYGYCQYDSAPAGGAWRYNCNEWPDNSSAQWGAIGLIPAQRVWGLFVAQIVKDWNRVWLRYTQNPSTGVFGYTDMNPIWGPYATTPSGMVQMAMDGIGRGSSPPTGPNWDKAETFMRDNFCNGGGPYNAVKDYYYGLFSFVKSLLLHDSNGDGVAEPIALLHSQTPGVPDIDWYAAEASEGAPCDGIARTLVNDQFPIFNNTDPAGFWFGHNQSGEQYYFETAMAIIMLNRTIFEAGAPVAVASAVPNPAVAGQAITLNGASSYHQDSGKAIDSWEWDMDNDGTFDVSGPSVATSFAALGDYSVRLRVTDDGSPEKSAETVLVVRVTVPPVAPTAEAGGPYAFCPGATPWFLDGSSSVNPDEGVSQPGSPGDTIVGRYAWDLDGDAAFDDGVGPTPDVTGFFQAKGPGAYLVQLRVTDTTATSFPSAGQPDLADTDSGQVLVKSAADPACSCVANLAARAKPGKAQLTWTPTGAHHYNVYRSTISGGPYLKIASTTSTYSTYLDAGPLTTGVTYYYVVRPAAINDTELCQSNQAGATIPAPLR